MHPYATDPVTGLSVDSGAFRQRAPHVILSDDPDTATMQTVQEMCRQIREAANDPLVQRCAINAARGFRGGPAWAGTGITDQRTGKFTAWQSIDPITMDETASGTRVRILAESCFWWCKHFLRFKHHGSMFEAWSADLGDPRSKLQLLIAPDVLVRMSRMEGDCAIYTMMLSAMLAALGIPYRIVTLAVDPMQPGIFTHVCARAILPSGQETLDASHGSSPGWQVPNEDIFRMWTFNEQGQRVNDGPRFNGLHAYRRRARRGMGATVCDDMGCYDDQTGAVVPGYGAGAGQQLAISTPSTGQFIDYTTGTVYPTSQTLTVPSQNSAQWATFASNMVKAGLTLAEINAIQPGTVVSANGAILRQNPGYAVGSPTISGNLGISSSALMLGGVLLVGVFAISMLKGGR